MRECGFVGAHLMREADLKSRKSNRIKPVVPDSDSNRARVALPHKLTLTEVDSRRS